MLGAPSLQGWGTDDRNEAVGREHSLSNDRVIFGEISIPGGCPHSAPGLRRCQAEEEEPIESYVPEILEPRNLPDS